jgi:hypothetical protein
VLQILGIVDLAYAQLDFTRLIHEMVNILGTVLFGDFVEITRFSASGQYATNYYKYL